MFLARMITRAKWQAKEGFAEGEIQADAISVDLRTMDNSLSFWKCGDGTTNEVEEAALALAAARDNVDRLDIVWISDDVLRADEQDWKRTEGNTPVPDLIGLHVDLTRLDYVRLGVVANSIAAAIKEERYKRLNKRRVANLSARAVQQERVDLDDLGEKMRREVSKALQRTEE